LFPDTFYTASLNSWASAIQQPHSEAQFCLIDSVAHYKALSGMEHEFLVVDAIHRSGTRIVLGLGRNAEPPSVAPKGAASKKPSSLPREAYGVQVSHDRSPGPILQQHGRSVPLSFIAFARTARSDGEADPRPSLLQLSTLLLTISECSPSSSLLQDQCCVFARATCLALIDLPVFNGEETTIKEEQRATGHGALVSLFSTGLEVVLHIHSLSTALGVLFKTKTPIQTKVHAGLQALCSAGMLYGDVIKLYGDAVKLYGDVVKSGVDWQRIRCAV
jgi:hypothetical protein